LEHAYINGDVLRWARERVGIPRNNLATAVGITQESLLLWESGTGYPSFGRAQELASILKVPFGYFFLSKPPAQTPSIPDLRTVNGERRLLSADFSDLLNDVLVKHDWYLDYIKQLGARPLRFVGKYSVSTPISQVVTEVSSVFGPEKLCHSASSLSEYLRLLTERAEALKILVMRGGVVRGNPHRSLSVTEFRGFAISDPLAPLIFINSKDAQAAQIFTLAHELIHVWIGQSGISDLDASSTSNDVPQVIIEQFCNRAAAEFLVPSDDFVSLWQRTSGDLESRADYLARRFKVSVPMILRRILEHGEISRQAFFVLLKAHQDKIMEAERRRQQFEEESSSGGNFYNTFFARNSRRFSRAITSAVQSGALSRLEAARMLGVRTATISKLTERIAL